MLSPYLAPAAPTLVGDALYTATDASSLSAVGARDGGSRWKVKFAGQLNASQPPTVADGVIYINLRTGPNYVEGRLVAVRAADGTRLWQTPDYQLTTLPAIADGVLYTGANHDIVALDSRDGTLRWRAPASSDGHAMLSPAVAAGLAYAVTDYGEIVALHASDGSRAWARQIAKQGDLYGAPVVSGDVVYASGASTLYALRASDGAPLWTHQAEAASSAAVVVAGGVVFHGASDEYLYALRASDGTVLWRASTHDAEQEGIRAWVGTPSVAQGVVFVGVSYIHNIGNIPPGGALYAFDASTGTMLWHSATQGAVAGPPRVGT